MTPTTLKAMVKVVLEENPVFNGVEVRNSDIALTVVIWQRYYGVSGAVMVEQLFDLPREDNVKRIRAKFNAEGKYMPTKLEVAIKRGINRQKWEAALGYRQSAPVNQETLSVEDIY